MLYFLKLNCLCLSATSSAPISSSSFLKRKKTILGSDDGLSEISSEQIIKTPYNGRKIILINGFLECLKLPHIRKFEFIKDFNDVIEQIAFRVTETPLLVFTVSDPLERSLTFLNKIFSQKIMQQKENLLSLFSINPPTEKNIDFILRRIANKEGLCLREEDLLLIKQQSNKDLRNAITTL